MPERVWREHGTARDHRLETRGGARKIAALFKNAAEKIIVIVEFERFAVRLAQTGKFRRGGGQIALFDRGSTLTLYGGSILTR